MIPWIANKKEEKSIDTSESVYRYLLLDNLNQILGFVKGAFDKVEIS
jgi:hypothetical protein